MYRVTGLDGTQYIAQDLMTLQQWVNEGRVTPQMMVEDMGVARTVQAMSLPGLNWPFQQPMAGVDPRNIPRGTYGGQAFYPRPLDSPVPSPMVKSIIAAVLSMSCCIPFGIVAVIYAAQVNTHNRNGDYAGAIAAAKTAHIWANAAIGISIVGIAIRILFLGTFGLGN